MGRDPKKQIPEMVNLIESLMRIWGYTELDQLAEHYSIHKSQISRWKRGEISKALLKSFQDIIELKNKYEK